MFQWSLFKVLKLYNICNAGGVVSCKKPKPPAKIFVFDESHFVSVVLPLAEKKMSVLAFGECVHNIQVPIYDLHDAPLCFLFVSKLLNQWRNHFFVHCAIDLHGFGEQYTCRGVAEESEFVPADKIQLFFDPRQFLLRQQ